MSTQQLRYLAALLCLTVCLFWSGHIFLHAEAHHDEHKEYGEHDREICLLCTLAKDVESVDRTDVGSILERSDAIVLPQMDVAATTISSPVALHFTRGPPLARRMSSTLT